MSTTIEDMKGGMSNCCGALMYEEWGICTDCKEHCESVEEEEPTDLEGRLDAAFKKADRQFSPAQLSEIAAYEKACVDAGCEGDEHKCV